ncbi:GMC oxidoreductase [Streptomyces sp. Tue6028]|uniref:GMC oxidoreductase n=1 Tax=Streptomyces sp. Tue6028 TaxID=2036037 RepID=UPI003D75F288
MTDGTRRCSGCRAAAGHGNEFPPEVNHYVGGNTKFYGAVLFRLRPEDFGELRHHDGVSPAWPIRYEDLEPYYTEAEHLYLVHGRHGEDPWEGPYSGQYAYPPVEHEPRMQQLSDDLEKQGLHPFHLPIGVDLTQDASGGATHSSCGQLRDPAAGLGERPAPGRTGEQLGRGRPALHAPQQPCPDGDFEGTQRHPVPEDPGPARLAHDLDNLYVVDTSFFPGIGAVNPSLTAIADALRVGDHIVERLS